MQYDAAREESFRMAATVGKSDTISYLIFFLT